MRFVFMNQYVTKRFTRPLKKRIKKIKRNQPNITDYHLSYQFRLATSLVVINLIFFFIVL